ncbi:MAG TPA: YdeI/OmpD-associated family protein [Candidatus Didemnitutus sp.]|nr:YdeI/OmpD-associated family protein [Candidatus Didemnitutus sp.]
MPDASRPMNAVYFKSAADFRRWLEKNHATATELLVGFFNKASGKGGLTYPESVDEALCFGWIDGHVKRIDAERHTRRFTPRRIGSIWSNINVGHAKRLTRAGKMSPAGLKAYAARLAHKTGVYSFEQKVRKPLAQKFPVAIEKIFRAEKVAWTFWQQAPPGYQRLMIHWVTAAKQEATRARRLARVIAASARGKRL